MEDNDAAPPRYTTRRRNAPLLQPLPDEVAQRKWNKKPAESSTVEPGTLFEVTEPPTMSEAVTKAIDEATSGVITEPKVKFTCIFLHYN